MFVPSLIASKQGMLRVFVIFSVIKYFIMQPTYTSCGKTVQIREHRMFIVYMVTICTTRFNIQKLLSFVYKTHYFHCTILTTNVDFTEIYLLFFGFDVLYLTFSNLEDEGKIFFSKRRNAYNQRHIFTSLKPEFCIPSLELSNPKNHYFPYQITVEYIIERECVYCEVGTESVLP